MTLSRFVIILKINIATESVSVRDPGSSIGHLLSVIRLTNSARRSTDPDQITRRSYPNSAYSYSTSVVSYVRISGSDNPDAIAMVLVLNSNTSCAAY